ncbi:MAG: YfgM family protein [Granulosicoccaceae bacterium]
MAYETDEQQVEALKAWWAENGRSIMLGAGLGLAVILGWQGYQRYEVSQAAEASDLYGEVAASTDASVQSGHFETLKADYSSTPYAGLAGLQLAKAQVLAEDFSAAETTLAWVAANAAENDVQAIATLRRARVLVELKRYDDALAALPEVPAPGFGSLQSSVRGDILLAQGNRSEARLAFQQALSAGGPVADQQLLQMKIDDLAEGSEG